MQIPDYSDLHLGYCSNIHPGEKLDEVLDQLQNHLPELKRRLSPDLPMGVGLRLSAQAADELLAGRMDELRSWLQRENLYVFTMNGFPYGNFHGTRVKEQVYKPEWTTPARIQYTLNLAAIFAGLLPRGSEGSISTSPLAYKFLPGFGAGVFRSMDEEQRSAVYRDSAHNLAYVAIQLAEIKKQQDVTIHLDIEPEPDCILENSVETAAFFRDHLFPKGSRYLAQHYHIPSAEAETILRDHIQVCYDTCHFAVEYEEPETVLDRLHQAGVRIGKLQISSALKVPIPETREERLATLDRLQHFVESTYLHQVMERRSDGSFHQYRDLPDALPHILNPDAVEWRIHFHIPVFTDTFDGLQSTRGDIVRSLELLKMRGFTRHLEVETYTWDVLPDGLKTDLTDSIERELRWTLSNFKQ